MNTITIELCAEDRARLDKIIKALEEKNFELCTECTATETQAADVQTKEEEPVEQEERKTEPALNVDLIQQKVISLAAMENCKHKSRVGSIVKAYAAKVSDIPEDKWTEVWEKLTELEKEVKA